jgi:hypothetical protein
MPHPNGAEGVGGGGHNVHGEGAQLVGLFVVHEASLRTSQATRQLVRPSQLTLRWCTGMQSCTQIVQPAQVGLRQ